MNRKQHAQFGLSLFSALTAKVASAGRRGGGDGLRGKWPGRTLCNVELTCSVIRLMVRLLEGWVRVVRMGSIVSNAGFVLSSVGWDGMGWETHIIVPWDSTASAFRGARHHQAYILTYCLR
ncbi:hypothetical protein BX600DRAFT_99243 [Xylariales sp. PMI_506]|nr:hypothetical protein BX600DRAFT_99243 [Xylariales sp. PMI_506]